VSTIVTISRQVGAGGAALGQAVAARLGFQYADRDILDEAARVLEASADDLEGLEERSEGFWNRVGHMFVRGTVDAPYVIPWPPIVAEPELFEAETAIVRQIAARGDAVIVGRGAAYTLAGNPGLFRLFLHAPVQSRIDRVMEEHHLGDAAAAAEMVARLDQQRARFVHTLTGRSWCDAALYDVSLNTAVIDHDAAVDITVELVTRFRASRAGSERPEPS
jgi:CMP/dCMP kinase